MANEVTESQKSSASMANQVDYQNISRFYANHAQLNVSLFEIRLIFNFLAGVNSETGHLMALDTMFVSMSPELAQSAYNLLGKALENYRRDYGQIRIPADTSVKVVNTIDETTRRALDMTDVLKENS